MPARPLAILSIFAALSLGSRAQDSTATDPFSGLSSALPPSAPEVTPAPAKMAGEAAAAAPADPAAVLSQPSPPNFLGMELPFLDPGSEVLSWNGTSWNVVNNRMFGARFEKYLNAPPADSQEDQAYRDTLRQILDALSPHQPNKGNLSKAVGLLPIAAAYYHDARLCESLSNTIYGIWLARRNVSELRKANAEMERQAKRQLWNASLSAGNDPLRDPPRTIPSNSQQGSNGNNNSSGNNPSGNNNGNSGSANIPGLSNLLGTQGLTGMLGTSQGAMRRTRRPPRLGRISIPLRGLLTISRSSPNTRPWPPRTSST